MRAKLAEGKAVDFVTLYLLLGNAQGISQTALGHPLPIRAFTSSAAERR